MPLAAPWSCFVALLTHQAGLLYRVPAPALLLPGLGSPRLPWGFFSSFVSLCLGSFLAIAWKAALPCLPAPLLLCTCPQGGGFASCLSSVPRAETAAPTYGMVAEGCTLPSSPTLTSWKIPAGQPAPDLGWPVLLAHWLNRSWLSSFCLELGLRRCDTVPNIHRLVQMLRHEDKIAAQGPSSLKRQLWDLNL